MIGNVIRTTIGNMTGSMTGQPRPRLMAAAILAAAFPSWFSIATAGERPPGVPGPRLDIQAVQGPNACAECHKRSTAIWKRSVHYRVIKETHLTKEAGIFAGRLGIRRIKHPESLCANCHYTVRTKRKRARAVAGISCESCHGASRDWIKLHANYSGKRKETESPEQARARWALSEKAGLIRPRNLYALARNCYSCHATAHEDLINVGRHPRGGNFELLSWMMGEVRHTVCYTAANDEASLERKRMLFLAGLSLSLETSLEALSAARKADGKYAADLRGRIKRAGEGLVETAVALPGLNEIKAMLDAVPPQGASATRLKASAAAVGRQARRLLQRDGSGMEGIDHMLPLPADYVGEVVHPHP